MGLVHRTHLALYIALATTVSIYIYGCGQAKEDSAHGPDVVPPAQFMRAAKAICQRANDERGEKGSAFLKQRAKETGQGLGLVGEVEMVQKVVAPSLSREVDRLEGIGLPRGRAYDAEALWQTLRIVSQEVEIEGIYAWRSAKLLWPFRNRAKSFGLDSCVIN
jgi:hypothetical protein